MTMQQTSQVPQYSQAVENDLAKLTTKAKAAPLFIIKVDENGDADMIAAPGRNYVPVPPRDPVQATALLQLMCASWQVYTLNPTRSRNNIGGDSYDGG